MFVYERNKYEDCKVDKSGGIERLEPISFREKETVGSYKMKPPISSQVNNPEQAGESLKPLFDFVYGVIPEQHRSSTPIFAFATAGLRVVADQEGLSLFDDDDTDNNNIFEEDDDSYGIGSVERILISVREYIQSSTPFLFYRDDQVRVITGVEEGKFDYLSIQHLLRLNPYAMMGDDTKGKEWSDRIFDHPLKQWEGAPVYPIVTIDLGGASTQISFAVTPTLHFEPSLISSSSSDLLQLPPIFSQSTESSKWNLFTHSFLNYGANRARDIYRESLYSKSLENATAYETPLPVGDETNPVIDPCLPPDVIERIMINMKGVEKEVVFKGIGSYLLCKSSIATLFSYSYFLPCSQSAENNCGFAQTKIPSISSSLSAVQSPSTNQMTLIAFDHAYRIGSLFGFHGYVSLYTMNRKITDHFRLSYMDIERIYNGEDEATRKKMGFELTYLYSLLSLGYNVDKNGAHVIFTDDISGYNLNWALGAMVFESYSLCVNGLI